MTKNELSRCKAVLNAKIIELGQLIRHHDAIRVERSADQLEDIQQASERALAAFNLDREFNQVRNARAAIVRIHEGSFGKCQQCHEDIHPKRLGPAPWSPFCIRCQEAFDSNPEEAQTPPRDLLPSKTLDYLL